MMNNIKNRSTSYDRADYAALKNGNISGLMGEMRHDAADDAALFFARELDYIKSKAYDKKYPKFTALEYFPHSSEVDPGAETTTYYSYDKVGMAQIINNYATDLPRADAKGKPSTSFIKSVGVSYGYSIQEMRASKFTGKSLDTRKAESARYQIDYILNKIAWAGDAENNILGVLSDGTQIPTYAIDAGAGSVTTWKDKTADEILDDVRNWTTYVSLNTKDVETPDSLLLPTDVYMDIATRRIPDTETTVLAYLLDKSPYLKNINPASELNADSIETNPYAKTGSGETGLGVAFLYTNDKDKFTIEDPLAFIQHPAQVRNLETVVPCEARTAGLIMYYPMSALIISGVSEKVNA